MTTNATRQNSRQDKVSESPQAQEFATIFDDLLHPQGHPLTPQAELPPAREQSSPPSPHPADQGPSASERHNLELLERVCHNREIILQKRRADKIVSYPFKIGCLFCVLTFVALFLIPAMYFIFTRFNATP